MAKKSLQLRDLKRRKMSASKESTRKKLLKVARDRTAEPEEIFKANLKLAKLPRNSSATRIHNRCRVTGRGRGVYRKFGLCRIILRDMAGRGEIPGVRKASW